MGHKGPVKRPRCIGTVRSRTQYIINQSINQVRFEGLDWVYTARDRIQRQAFVITAISFCFYLRRIIILSALLEGVCCMCLVQYFVLMPYYMWFCCKVPVNENVFMWCKTSGCLSGSQRSIECNWNVSTLATEIDSCQTWQRIVLLTSMVLRILDKEPMPSRILRTRAALWMVCSASLLSLAAFARIISSSVSSASAGYTTHINKLSLCDNVGWLLELVEVFWHWNWFSAFIHLGGTMLYEQVWSGSKVPQIINLCYTWR